MLIIIHLGVFGFKKFIEISVWLNYYLGDVFEQVVKLPAPVDSRPWR